MKKKAIIFLLCFFGMTFSGCLKKAYETPDTNVNVDPYIPVNCSIEKLNMLAPLAGAPVLIDSDWTIVCIVRADDESGNIYNQLIVEDSTAGIVLLLNENSLYTRYPIGRKLYIHLKGLYIGNNHGTYQLGSIPAPDNSGVLQVSDVQVKAFATHIVPANIAVAMDAKLVKLADLMMPRKDLLSRLIRIEDVELENPDYDNIYADPSGATSIPLRNCSGASIVLRTSNYASFQSFATPRGKGSITAIYSLYNDVGQLTIRDTSDLQMNNIRCDGSTGGNTTLLSIDSIRKMYRGRDTVLGSFKIRAVVTSDALNKNFGTGNIIVQQEQRAIMIYFGSSASALPEMGDSVEINISGATLTRYNDALEIKNIKISKLSTIAKNIPVVPVTISIADLNANFSNYESVLVKILKGKITSSGNFSGNKILTDAIGTITLYTSSVATFANTAVPTITKTFQGIATPYGTTNEIKIRNPEVDIY